MPSTIEELRAEKTRMTAERDEKKERRTLELEIAALQGEIDTLDSTVPDIMAEVDARIRGG